METITKNTAKKLIEESNGKIFTVTFIKKDGSLREMNCRLGVKQHRKGGELAYDPKKYNLIVVFDLQKMNYRMINALTIKQLNINSQKFTVNG